MCARWVNERHQRAFGAGPRLLVDQPHAARFELREDRADVLDPQRDVMQAGAALLEIPGNRRVRRGRFEELELGLANRYEMRADVLRHDLFRRLDLEAKRVAIKRKRGLEILDRNADVIEESLHHFSDGLKAVRYVLTCRGRFSNCVLTCRGRFSNRPVVVTRWPPCRDQPPARRCARRSIQARLVRAPDVRDDP